MYELLLQRHAKMVVCCKPGFTELLRGERTTVEVCSAENINRDCETMDQYIDYVQNSNNWVYLAAKKREHAGRSDEELNDRVKREKLRRQQHTEIVVAWFTMIIRGVCWYRLHYLEPGLRIGSQYWDSQQSLYIT
jgi:hypothetical protein